MPEEEQVWMPREERLSYEEIMRVLRVTTGLGLRKLRVTGGEPLTRPGISTFLGDACSLPGVEEVGVSTNGTMLALPDPEKPWQTYAESFAKAGVRGVNVSLDTIDREAYAKASGRDFLPKTLAGLQAAKEAGLEVKLNCVLMRGVNETTLPDLVDYAREMDFRLRFIELMPISTVEVLSEDNFLSAASAKQSLELCFGSFKQRPDLKGNGPSQYHEILATRQIIGFISPLTDEHFCEDCNKLRLTCEGKLRPCLGNHLEFDLRAVLRRKDTSDAAIAAFFYHVVANKPKEHLFRDAYQPQRRMIAIGG